MHLKKTDSNSITRRQWWYLVLLLAGIGLNDSGENVRITWSDFQTSVVPVNQGTFLVPREGEFMPQRIEVLDDSGNSVAEEVW